MTSGFTAQLREIQAMVGTGVPDSPAAALSGIHAALTEISGAATTAWQRTGWSGAAGDAASDFTRSTVEAVTAVANRAEGIGAAAGRASDAVARARARLRAIIERFEARAAALEPHLDEPGVADELIDEGRRAVAEAEAVVDELRAELDGHADAVVTQPTIPALPNLPGWGMPGGATPGLGGAGSGVGSGIGSGVGSGSGPGAMESAPQPVEPVDAAEFGTGESVLLPGGGTAMAPNAVAASAVRHALTQLGVPYRWGGEAPGVAMDCSGLTQWAYHEAGLDLPRLAQEQDIGKAVDRGSLRPGDLAVWDGHVAMIVGDGTMIEAGDPVHLSPIRTTNAGQGFQGFWRPTA